MQAAALPETLGRYSGRIVDVDSHEMMPAQIWTETFGEVARPIAELIMTQAPRIVAAERGDIFICEGAMGKGGGIGLMATPMCSNLMNSAGHRLRPFSTAAEIAPI